MSFEIEKVNRRLIEEITAREEKRAQEKLKQQDKMLSDPAIQQAIKGVYKIFNEFVAQNIALPDYPNLKRKAVMRTMKHFSEYDKKTQGFIKDEVERGIGIIEKKITAAPSKSPTTALQHKTSHTTRIRMKPPKEIGDESSYSAGHIR